MMPIRGGYSAFSSGPIFDTTPKDPVLSPICGHPAITDAPIENSSYGPPYEVPAADESDFDKLAHKLENKPGVTNPKALASVLGREKLGQAEMTRRSVEGRKD